MAGPLGRGPGTERRRVFVLVDNGLVQGIFNSWDAAESYADEHRLSLDHLMEYETRRDYPDHLHLLSAQWDAAWEFQGQWSKHPPRWSAPPTTIRLDHYHASGDKFTLFRQKDFPYENGILDRINPMAPDAALLVDLPTPKAVPAHHWKPKLAPLKPLAAEPEKPVPPPELESMDSLSDPAHPAEGTELETPAGETPDKVADISPASAKDPTLDLPTEPESVTHSTPENPADETEALPIPPEPLQLKKPLMMDEPDPVEVEEKEEGDEFSDLRQKPRISMQKGRSLKLKSKGLPQPIPAFKPTMAAHIEMHGNVSTVELAYADQQALAKKAEAEKPTGKPRRIWSMRLIVSVVMVGLCWGNGLFWVLRPEPTAAAIVAEVTSLRNARTLIFEPEMVFFQLEVEPAHQERWIQSLRLQPLEKDTILPIPTYHALDTWTRPEGFVRPPYALVEVDEWLDLRLRKIQYGFIHRWDDGSILILDLESDMMIGWGYAKRYPELLN